MTDSNPYERRLEEANMNAIDQFLVAIQKDIYVFRMARAQMDRPGARKRAVEAARRLLGIIADWE